MAFTGMKLVSLGCCEHYQMLSPRWSLPDGLSLLLHHNQYILQSIDKTAVAQSNHTSYTVLGIPGAANTSTNKTPFNTKYNICGIFICYIILYLYAKLKTSALKQSKLTNKENVIHIHSTIYIQYIMH